jgi:hypothetical protein
MVPVLATVAVWSVLVVNVIPAGLTVASHFPLATDSEPMTVPLTLPAAPAWMGATNTAHSRTAAVAAALRALR